MLSANIWEVVYTIEVENLGSNDEIYDLTDTPGFEDDITINSASFTSNAGLSGTLSTSNNTANTLGDDVTITGGQLHIYTLTYNLTLDLSPGSTDNGDN